MLIFVICITIFIAIFNFWRSSVKLRRKEQLIKSYEDAHKQVCAQLNNLAISRQIELNQVRKEEKELANSAAKLALESWIFDNEKRIREDAIKKSQAITKGKVTEHIIPYFPEFKYDPRDARFLGSPIDLIIFDGLSDGKLNSIILVEVKTGSSGLTERERQIKNIVDQKLVRYEVIRK